MDKCNCPNCSVELKLGDLWWGECSACKATFEPINPFEYMNLKGQRIFEDPNFKMFKRSVSLIE
jgi:glyoxylate carboligase